MSIRLPKATMRLTPTMSLSDSKFQSRSSKEPSQERTRSKCRAASNEERRPAWPLDQALSVGTSGCGAESFAEHPAELSGHVMPASSTACASRRQLSMFWRSRTYLSMLYGISSPSSKKSVAAASQLATRGCRPYMPLHTLSENAALST